jgi:transposase-like protein
MNRKQEGRREEWLQRIGEQKESGVSIRAYCKRHGIAEHVFYGWRQRLRNDEQVSFALVDPKLSNDPAQPIELVLSRRRPGRCIIM